MLVAPLYANEPSVQIQYLQINIGVLRWFYWLRNSIQASLSKESFSGVNIKRETCVAKKTCVHGTLQIVPLKRA